jgi:hypothetical protein
VPSHSSVPSITPSPHSSGSPPELDDDELLELDDDELLELDDDELLELDDDELDELDSPVLPPSSPGPPSEPPSVESPPQPPSGPPPPAPGEKGLPSVASIMHPASRRPDAARYRATKILDMTCLLGRRGQPCGGIGGGGFSSHAVISRMM